MSNLESTANLIWGIYLKTCNKAILSTSPRVSKEIWEKVRLTTNYW